MPLPPNPPFLFLCSQCDWQGPVQISDCFIGPIDYCPDCESRLVRTNVTNTAHSISLREQFFKWFSKN